MTAWAWSGGDDPLPVVLDDPGEGRGAARQARSSHALPLPLLRWRVLEAGTTPPRTAVRGLCAAPVRDRLCVSDWCPICRRMDGTHATVFHVHMPRIEQERIRAWFSEEEGAAWLKWRLEEYER
jgi:hypothetical protein